MFVLPKFSRRTLCVLLVTAIHDAVEGVVQEMRGIPWPGVRQVACQERSVVLKLCVLGVH